MLSQVALLSLIEGTINQDEGQQLAVQDQAEICSLGGMHLKMSSLHLQQHPWCTPPARARCSGRRPDRRVAGTLTGQRFWSCGFLDSTTAKNDSFLKDNTKQKEKPCFSLTAKIMSSLKRPGDLPFCENSSLPETDSPPADVLEFGR